jgi:hypothetical protein
MLLPPQLLLGALAGGYVAWNWGWNSAVRLYEHRAAHERAVADRR